MGKDQLTQKGIELIGRWRKFINSKCFKPFAIGSLSFSIISLIICLILFLKASRMISSGDVVTRLYFTHAYYMSLFQSAISLFWLFSIIMAMRWRKLAKMWIEILDKLMEE